MFGCEPWCGRWMKILANIKQERYFLISEANWIFAGLSIEKTISWTNPIHLEAQNREKVV
jgi:hypothetical protein